MTAREWNDGIEWLTNGEEGCFVENDGRKAEVVNMCGGRYLLTDENNEFVGVTFEEWRAMEFVKSGRVLLERM